MDTDEGLARDWLEGIAQLFAHVVVDVEAAPAPVPDATADKGHGRA
jgi:hypothetical protein